MRIKTLSIMSACITASLMFAACTESRTDDLTTNKGKKITNTAIAHGEETRIQVGEPDGSTYPVLWEGNETLKIFERSSVSTEACDTGSCDVSSDSRSATFSFSVTEKPGASGFRYHALHPASAYVSHNGTDVDLTIPSVQHPSAGSFDPEAAIMLATDPDTYNVQPAGSTAQLAFRFSHLTAYGKMTLTGLPSGEGAPSSVMIETAATPLTGACRYNIAGTAEPLTADNNTLTLAYDNPTSDDTPAMEAWFASAVGTIADGDSFTVTVSYPSGLSVRREVTVPSGRGIEFEAGRISSFTVDMGEAESEYPITIPEILDGISSTSEAIDATKDRVLYAVVTVDAANGNFTSNNVMIQTPGSTDPDNGLILYGPTSANYRFGDLLRINLRKGSAERVNYRDYGQLEITGVNDSDIEVLDNITIEPVPVDAADMKAYHGMLVKLRNVKSPAGGGTWCTTYDGKHNFTSADGSQFTVFVKKNATKFLNQAFFEATGDITGYVSIYRNSPQLCPNSLDDVAAFCTEQEPAPVDYIYYENFDGNTSLYNIWLNRSTEWQNFKGTGSDQVGYTSWNVQLRNNLSQYYEDASGNCYAYVFSEEGNNLTVNGISLGSEEVNLRLTFGGNFTAEDMTVSVASSERSAVLTYTGPASNGTWTKYSVDFTLTTPVDKLSLTFTKQNTSFSPGIDDIKLEAIDTPSGQTIDLSAPAYDYAWAEIPDINVSNSDWKTITHWTTTVVSKKSVRNYTSCYDTRRHCPMWVAYPLHECYREGSGRSSTSSWRPDPNLTDDEQSIIYVWSDQYPNHQYWTNDVLTSLGRSDTWTRGHMLMSNYRPGKEEEINLQTFYSTNIAPQGFDAFSAKWLQAEERALNYQCADTLYYVSGCYFANENWKEKDASNWGSLSPASKECVVPTHFYKVLLRTKSGISGKAVQECTADELQAIAIWFEHAEADPVSGASADYEKWPLTATDFCSVAELERRIGNEFTFFPDIPSAVKESYSLSDWSELIAQ